MTRASRRRVEEQLSARENFKTDLKLQLALATSANSQPLYVCVCLCVKRRPAAQGDLITDVCSACQCKSHSVSVKSRTALCNHGGGGEPRPPPQ